MSNLAGNWNSNADTLHSIFFSTNAIGHHIENAIENRNWNITGNTIRNIIGDLNGNMKWSLHSFSSLHEI